MTPERVFLGLLAVAAVAIALGVWVGPISRVARALAPVPDLVAAIRELAGIVDENTEATKETGKAAKGAAAVTGHVYQVLDKALGNGAPSKPGVTSTGTSRPMSADMAGAVLAREVQPSRPEVDPPTARGVAMGGRGE